jgi:hypothetical protein
MKNINETTDNIFVIHENFFPEVEKKINRVIRKCKKYGNDFIFEIIGEDMRRDSRADLNDPSNKYNDIFHKFIIVKVEGEAKAGDWEFIATLNVRKNGNVIRRYNYDVKIPERFKTSRDVCEHCNTVRNRKNLYVVRNIETGEFKQVGGNCLMSYTGISLDFAAAIMDGIDHMYDYDNMYDESYGSGTRYYDVKNVISYAATIISKMGYSSSESVFPTKRAVMHILAENNFDSALHELNAELLDAMYNSVWFEQEDFTKDNSEEVDAIINYYMSLDGDNEFVHNMKTIISDGYATYKDLGFLCYAPQGYAKHIEREIERAKRDVWKRIHWGEIGKRYKNVPVKEVRKTASFETIYGIMNVWQIITDEDVVLTWKSSNYPEDEAASVSFTIKEHVEYNGVPQTIVTRCNFAA